MDDYSFSPARWWAALTNRIMRLRDDVKGALFLSLTSLVLVLFGLAFMRNPIKWVFLLAWGGSIFLFYRRHKHLFAFLNQEVRHKDVFGVLFFVADLLLVVILVIFTDSPSLSLLLFWVWFNLVMVITILRSRYLEKKARTDANQT
jgi:hypothetical protein